MVAAPHKCGLWTTTPGSRHGLCVHKLIKHEHLATLPPYPPSACLPYPATSPANPQPAPEPTEQQLCVPQPCLTQPLTPTNPAVSTAAPPQPRLAIKASLAQGQ